MLDCIEKSPFGGICVKMQWIKIVGFSLSIGLISQLSNAAAIKDVTDSYKPPMTKNLQIEKALQQQKHNLTTLPTTDSQLMMLNTLHSEASQSFFAMQHQRFSRFLQVFFQPHTS